MNVLVNFSLGLATRMANNELFKKRLKRSTKKWKGRKLGDPADEQLITDGEDSSDEAPARLQRYLPKSPLYEYSVHKLDVRLMNAEDLDAQGRFHASPMELLHPTSVFGELRLMALKEHGRKHQAIFI